MRKKLKTIKLAKIRRLIRQICRKYPNPKEIEKTTLKVYDIAIGKMSKEINIQKTESDTDNSCQETKGNTYNSCQETKGNKGWMIMERKKVESKNIKSAGYDELTSTLEVEFIITC